MPSARATRTGTRQRRGACLAALLAFAAMQGCTSVSHETTGSVDPAAPAGKPVAAMSAAELARAVQSYGRAYEADPKDRGVGMSYAAVLQMTGRNEQSLAVMRQVAIAHPEDRAVLAAYGKALAAAGHLEKALDTVQRAQTPDYPDWRLISAEGAILDQLGRSEEARSLYRKALDLKPNEPTVLSNLGMSYLLTDDLQAAEKTLRRAAEQPDGDSRVRQNLALVVGLQGRFDEAERIASATLSPDQARANITYLRDMLAKQGADRWSELQKADGAGEAAGRG